MRSPPGRDYSVGVLPVLRRNSRITPLFEPPRRSLTRLYARYTPGELEVILDFLTRSAERLRSETAKLTGGAAWLEAGGLVLPSSARGLVNDRAGPGGAA